MVGNVVQQSTQTLPMQQQLSISERKSPVVLPYELEREIFELAAYAFPGHAFKLCTLSRYVQEWMEAILYAIVVLDFPLSTVKLFMRTFHSRPVTFFARTVKHLYMTPTISFTEARQIAAACTGARNVVCWADAQSGEESFLPLPPTQQLQRLSIKLDSLSQPLAPNPFPNLSHLEIVSPPSLRAAKQIDWDCLTKLPKLTHLAFGNLWTSIHLHYLPHFEKILGNCHGLIALILLSNDTSFLKELEKSDLQRDPRVIVKEEFNGSTPLPEYWERIRRGGPDFWESVDELTAERTPSNAS